MNKSPNRSVSELSISTGRGRGLGTASTRNPELLSATIRVSIMSESLIFCLWYSETINSDNVSYFPRNSKMTPAKTFCLAVNVVGVKEGKRKGSIVSAEEVSLMPFVPLCKLGFFYAFWSNKDDCSSTGVSKWSLSTGMVWLL